MRWKTLGLAILVPVFAGLVGCGAVRGERVQAVATLPDSAPAGPPAVPQVACSDGTSAISLATCPSAAQQRKNEQQRMSQTILDIHAHGG